jgi:hypothetical protein
MLTKTILIKIFTLFSVVCIAQKSGIVKDGFINTEIDMSVLVEIEVKTFKALFRENASATKNKATYYFIRLKDSLNSTLPLVIDKLRKVKPEVKDLKYFDSLTKDQQAKIDYLSFSISKVILNNKRASVYCGYYEGSLSSSGNVIELKKRFGKWRVISNEVMWIS